MVKPRKTRPCLTERLLMGCKESNQTKQTKDVLKFRTPIDSSHSTNNYFPLKHRSAILLVQKPIRQIGKK